MECSDIQIGQVVEVPWHRMLLLLPRIADELL